MARRRLFEMSKHKTYWYQISHFVRAAFLYNCRDDDLRQNSSSRIPAGRIVAGQVGYVIAERAVLGFEGKIVDFEAYRQCDWQGNRLACMVHKSTPSGKLPKAALRHYNYVVAELPVASHKATALAVGVPIIVSASGR